MFSLGLWAAVSSALMLSSAHAQQLPPVSPAACLAPCFTDMYEVLVCQLYELNGILSLPEVIICPGTTIEVGDFGNLFFTANGFRPPLFALKPNTHFKCGPDGKKSTSQDLLTDADTQTNIFTISRFQFEQM